MRKVTGDDPNQEWTSLLRDPPGFNNFYYNSVVFYNSALMKTSGIYSVEVIYELNTELPTWTSEVKEKGRLSFISRVLN